MKLFEQYYCKRLALNMTTKEFASIAGVDEGIYTIWENGGYIRDFDLDKIKRNVEQYIRSFPREKYLRTRILEETFMMERESADEHVKTLSHLMIHVSKLNMMYVGDKEWD